MLYPLSYAPKRFYYRGIRRDLARETPSVGIGLPGRFADDEGLCVVLAVLVIAGGGALSDGRT